MKFPKISRVKLMVVVPTIVGMLTAAFLWVSQEPIYAMDGIIRYNNALDPHMFIIYTLLSVILSAALVDLAYRLVNWCKKQCLANTEV